MSTKTVKLNFPYIIGLDLGSNSVGFSLITNPRVCPDLDATQYELLKLGSHIFEEAGTDNVKTGKRELKNQERRKARLARRTYRRRKWRKESLYELLTQVGVLMADQKARATFLCAHTLQGNPHHPLYLRTIALDSDLSPADFAKVLCHLNRQRGYLSTGELMSNEIPEILKVEARKVFLAVSDEEDDDEQDQGEGDEKPGVILGGIRNSHQAISSGKARTYGELLFQNLGDGLYSRHYTKRFTKKVDKPQPLTKQLAYRSDRALIHDELNKLWTRQANAHPEVWTHDLKAKVERIIFYQKELKDTSSLRKTCQAFPSHYCSPKTSRASQRARITQDLFSSIRTGEKTKKVKKVEANGLPFDASRMSDEIIPPRTVLSEASVRSLLAILEQGHDLPIESLPNLIKETFEVIKRSKLDKYQGIFGNQTIKIIRKASYDQWDTWDEALQNHVLDVVSSASTPSKTYKALVSRNIDKQIAANIALAPFTNGYAEYSTKFLNKVNESMITKGIQQKVALDELNAIARDHKRNHLSSETPLDPDKPNSNSLINLPTNLNYRNPIVEKALRRTVWVLNQVIYRYGIPETIRVELPRELTMPAKDKKKLEDRMVENENLKKALAQELLKAGQLANGSNIKKLRLLKECDFILPYEGKQVSINDIEDLEIDHVVPRATMWINQSFNLVVCFRGTNQQKGEMPLYDWLTPDEFSRFETRIKHSKMGRMKKAWVTKKEPPEEGFLESQLHATGYLSREIRKVLSQLGTSVEVTNGQATAHLRRLWGLEDNLFPDWLGMAKQLKAEKKGEATEELKNQGKNRSDHRHHAVDALVIALTDVSTFQALSRANKFKHQNENHRANYRKTCPIEGLREHVYNQKEGIVVTNYTRSSTTGPLNKAMAQKEDLADLLEAQKLGLPMSSKVGSGKLVRYDIEGKAAQAYPLGENHHMTIYKGKSQSGQSRLHVSITPLIDVARNVKQGNDPYEEKVEATRIGFEKYFTLEKGEIVEFGDFPNNFYKVAALSVNNSGGVSARFQKSTVNTMEQVLFNRVHDDVPIIRNLGLGPLEDIIRKVKLNAFGEVIWEERIKTS
ncbi:MAG: type II CRISPR RNA-guided endonuclease Cas9 [Armatimonadota bacterium]